MLHVLNHGEMVAVLDLFEEIGLGLRNLNSRFSKFLERNFRPGEQIVILCQGHMGIDVVLMSLALASSSLAST